MSRSYSKSELAALAGVSYSTFYRFLCSHRKELVRLGVSRKSQLLRGRAFEYVLKAYDIDLPEEEPSVQKKHIKFR